jgi:hypothetical protein
MCPFEEGQIQTSVYAGGMAKDLIRVRVAGSLMVLPSGPVYVKPLPDLFRRIPGVVSLT